VIDPESKGTDAPAEQEALPTEQKAKRRGRAHTGGAWLQQVPAGQERCDDAAPEARDETPTDKQDG